VRYWIDRSAEPWDPLRRFTAPGPVAPFEAAAFALVPYSNRIRGSRFTFEGRDVSLPLNRPPERHSIQGSAGRSLGDQSTCARRKRRVIAGWAGAFDRRWSGR